MTENILIWAARNGSEIAFKRLFDKNFNTVYYFLMQFSDNRDDVEDWVQLTFIRAFEKLEDFEGKSKFSSWLIAISLNIMRRAKGVYHNRMRDEFDENIHDSSEEPESEFIWKHDMKWLLDDFDEHKKAVFILFEIEGFSHAEIAEMLEISEANSKVILNRTKKLLREKWQLEESR